MIKMILKMPTQNEDHEIRTCHTLMNILWNMLQLLSWEMRPKIIYWRKAIFLVSLQKNSIFGEREDYQGAN